VDVVVVNHNTCEHLDTCLSALREIRGACIVVDNASTDGSAAMVRQRYPRVLLLANEHNLGYGAAANQGIASCASKYVLVLNSDTVIAHGTVASLSEYLDRHAEVAVVGPRITYPDGRLQPSCNPFPTLLPTFLLESATGPLLRYVPVARERYLPTWSHSCAQRVPWVMGAALAIRRTAFEVVGGFDTSFFMYFEEVDLCYRLAAAGWQVHFAPVATVVHVGAGSTRRRRSDMAVQALASRMRFYRRHYAAPKVLALVILIDAIVLVRCLLGPTRIRLADDETRRAQLRDDLVAWRRALRGEWLRPVALSEPRDPTPRVA
jgi:N-acetylglucosaminyl-diphospho-decaprenol L-rhamnosyltransferase